MFNSRFINPQILEEINNKIIILSKRKSILSHWLQGLHEHSIEKEATIHSFKIESASEFYTGKPIQSKDVKHGIRDLKRALSWGVDNYDVLKIDDYFINELAEKVDPDQYERMPHYRLGSVRPSGATWTPPSADKVPLEIERFVGTLRDILVKNTFAGVIEASAYAHLHLVRIHPFHDGNGRTARTLQNVILLANKLPPPIIYEEERHDYYQHLDRAINSWRARTGIDGKPDSNSDEGMFYNYIAGKISSSLTKVIS